MSEHRDVSTIDDPGYGPMKKEMIGNLPKVFLGEWQSANCALAACRDLRDFFCG
jgi:hypothetical protein